jgi:hypothetical protein
MAFTSLTCHVMLCVLLEKWMSGPLPGGFLSPVVVYFHFCMVFVFFFSFSANLGPSPIFVVGMGQCVSQRAKTVVVFGDDSQC